VGVSACWALCLLCAVWFRLGAVSVWDPGHRLNFPARALATEARARGFDGGLIVGESSYLAADLRLQFPDSFAVCPGWQPDFVPRLLEGRGLLVLWKGRDSASMPARVRNVLEEDLRIDSSRLRVECREFPLQRSNKDSVSVAFAALAPESVKAVRLAVTGRSSSDP
jgi:hypothetical protein